ncbi:hypothetical protein GCM10029964_097170 [Kibdelosporangium lantanae]
MSDLVAAIQSVKTERHALTAAAQRLFQTWRDDQAVRFQREVLNVLDREMSTMELRLTEADHDLDRVLRRLRDLGCR